MLEDREGDLWVGTNNGVERFSAANVVTEPTLSIRAVGAEITATPDAVYIGDGNPPPKPATGHDAVQIYAVGKGAPQPVSIAVDELIVLNGQGADSVLIGTRRKLFRLRDGVATSIAFPAGALGGDLSSATQAGDDIWAIFSERGLFHRHGEIWTQVIVPGLQTIATTRMRVDQQGGAWLFDDDRVERLVGGRLATYEDANGPNTAGVNAFNPAPDGVLMGGLQGISWFDGRQFHTLSRRQLPAIDVTGVVADDMGGTWIHTTSGIYRVATQQLQQAFRDPLARVAYQLSTPVTGCEVPPAPSSSALGRARPGRSAVVPEHGQCRLDRPASSVPQCCAAAGQHPIRHSCWANFGPHERQSPPGGDVEPADRLRRPQPAEPGPGHLPLPTRGHRPRLGRGRRTARGLLHAPRTRPLPVPCHRRQQRRGLEHAGCDARLRDPADAGPKRSGSSGLLALALLAVLFAVFAWRMRLEMARMQVLFDTRIGERERIARELHDTLLQGIQGLMLQFQSFANRLPKTSEDRRAPRWRSGPRRGRPD